MIKMPIYKHNGLFSIFIMLWLYNQVFLLSLPSISIRCKESKYISGKIVKLNYKMSIARGNSGKISQFWTLFQA